MKHIIDQPLTHLAIIPDGNRRWAKKHAIVTPSKMYEQGGDKLAQIVEATFQHNVAYLTLWIGSRANLQSRSSIQVRVLEDLYVKKFHELAEHPLIHDNHIKIQVCGEWQDLVRPEVNDAIQLAMGRTKQYDSGRYVTILVGYDGRRERGAAVQSLLADSPNTPKDPTKADDLLRQHSWTGHLPDVDLVIRTGSWQDPHNSAAFLSLLTNESQYSYPEVLWPDFTTDMLGNIINDYATRERRLGR